MNSSIRHAPSEIKGVLQNPERKPQEEPQDPKNPLSTGIVNN